MSKDKIFANGASIKKHEFSNGGHILKVGIKVDDFMAFISEYKKDSGWINMNICESQGGKMYMELDTWEAQQPQQAPAQQAPQQQYQQPAYQPPANPHQPTADQLEKVADIPAPPKFDDIGGGGVDGDIPFARVEYI